MMHPALLGDPRLDPLLRMIDEDCAAEVKAAGCPHCGEKLHSACYPRHLRGQAPEVAQSQQRQSYCCSADDCRRRVTPPSVRFLGRRHYLSAVVVVLSAVSERLDSSSTALCARLGISRRTLQRWRQWWRTSLNAPLSPFWQVQKGRFMPPLDPDRMPASLWERFRHVDPLARMAAILQFLSPLSTTSVLECHAW